jgi:hypothetical protein
LRRFHVTFRRFDVNYELKPLSRDAVTAALEKAERYRLLNEPAEAESICLDVLAIDATNQQALVTLLLALTDQFPDGMSTGRARALAEQLEDEYQRAYYCGVVSERLGKAQLHRGGLSDGFAAHHSLLRAMEFYERAEVIRPAGLDDAVLRWNACARLLMSHPELHARVEEREEPVMLE